MLSRFLTLVTVCLTISLIAFACSTVNSNDMSLVSTIVPSVMPTQPFFVSVTPSISAELRYEFEVENIAPDHRLVQISQLDLKPTQIILVQDVMTQKLKFIIGHPPFTENDFEAPQGIRNNTIEFSPDHRMISFLVYQDKKNGLASYDLWVSKVDGSQSYSILSNLEGGLSTQWLNEKEIALWWKNGKNFDCPEEITVIDVLSKNVRVLPGPYSLSGGNRAFCFPVPLFSPDLSKAIYLESGTGWKLVDYQDFSIKATLSKLDISPGGDKFNLSWTPQGVAFAFPGVNEIGFASNISDLGLFATNLNIKVVHLPSNFNIVNNSLEVWKPDDMVVGFDLNKSDEPNLTSFVLADLKGMILKDYSLDRSVFADQRGTPWFAFISANNDFVGWAVMQTPQNYPAIGSVLLNTKNGYISYLSGLEILGFGEIEP